MDREEYLEKKIREFEEKLVLIAACRQEEMNKPHKKRNYRLLYMFHKDEALYHFCLTEFKMLQTNWS